jgi:hypothetical protein
MAAEAGYAEGGQLQPRHTLNKGSLNAKVGGPLVGRINSDYRFEVTLRPLLELRDAISSNRNDYYEVVSRTVKVGLTDAQGECADLKPAGTTWAGGDSLSQFQRSASWTSRGTVTLSLNMRYTTRGGLRYWRDRDRPCVVQEVTWETPDVMRGGHYHKMTNVSSSGLTPNVIYTDPARMDPAPADPPANQEAPPNRPALPGLDLGDIDPSLLTGPDIVLPDFWDEDEDFEQQLVDSIVGSGSKLNPDQIRAALNDLQSKWRILANLLGVQQQGQEQDVDAQRNALRNAAINPQQIADAIAEARSVLNRLLGIGSSGAGNADPDGPAALLVDQLEIFAADAPVQVAGGVVRAEDLATAVGFNASQAPVAGLSGAGSIAGLRMNVQGPSTAKRGKGAAVRVSVSPKTTAGAVRLALVRNTSKGLQIVGAKQVTIRKGKASTRLAIPRSAASGAYSLVASLVPKSRAGTGITVQRPIRIS